MEIVLVLALVGVLIFFLVRGRGARGAGAGFRPRARSGFRCADCRHRRRLLEDGVICGFNDADLYKNPVQIRTCMNYEKEA